MDKRLDGRPYGYLTTNNNKRYVRVIDHQQVAGYSVGIVYIEDVHYPMMPGNVVNAYTYDFPVRMKAVPNLTAQKLFDGDPTIVDDVLATAKYMVEKEGVRAICSACGFFGNYHKQIAAELDVPVALSSLVQIPWIRSIIKPGQKIGILTASGSSVTPELLKSCGVDDADDLIFRGMEKSENFSAVCTNVGYWDNGKCEEEIVNASLELLEDEGDIGAILLECSDMPPYAYAVQEATQLPVFDFITLIKWLHNATTQRPYCGWI